MQQQRSRNTRLEEQPEITLLLMANRLLL
jgi:hypothetical protein